MFIMKNTIAYSIQKTIAYALFTAGLAAFASCSSAETQAQKLSAPRLAQELRLADITKAAAEDPVRAIHLIGMYRVHFPLTAEIEAELASLWDEAAENLKAAQSRAFDEKRFDDAVSMARSLANLGVTVESTGQEPEVLLAQAKDALEKGDNIRAFITASESASLKPLSAADAVLFLNRAVQAGQRRTAAYFLSAADTAGARDAVTNEARAFAGGRDEPRDMIKGVATVLVDQGTKLDKGRAYPSMMLGSAFFVDKSGLLITNYHVIQSEVDPEYEGYSRMYIRMGDAASPRIPAQVVGYDKAMDLALIKTSFTPEYVFSLVDWAMPTVGEPVLAIGSPVGLEKTVTQGIVSALGRRLLQIGDVIQIDAAVNHGNSGGPVVDRDGRLVGVVFAGVEQFQGLNFAIPAERLAAALPALLKGGKAERPWIGVSLAETGEGAEITYIAPFTPAFDLGVKEGSVILSVNGAGAGTSALQGSRIPSLQDTLFATRAGELVALETADGGKYLMMSQVRPVVPLADAAKKDSRERMTGPLFGFILAPSLGKGSSYTVKQVIRGSIADDAGLSKDDPVTIRGFRLEEKNGYAFMDINVKKRRMGYLETSMRLPAYLDTPDTL